MLPEGWVSLVALLDGRPDADPITRVQRLCELCAMVTGVSGVALGISSNGQRSTVSATDTVSDRIEELQVTLSEGPSVDALRHGFPVMVSDLAGDHERWPWFTPAALELGARSVFALPLQVGAVRLGVLVLYRASPGGLEVDQLRDARVLAEAASVLLTLDRPGEDAAEAFLWVLGDRSRFRAEVHQAVGATMVHLNIDARDAFARICAYAYAQETSIAVVAAQIMNKQLRLDPD